MTAFAHIAGPAFSRPVQIAARLYIVTTPSATTPCANGSRNKNLNSCSTKAKGLVMALGFFLWTAYWYVLGICIWYWYLVVLSGGLPNWFVLDLVVCCASWTPTPIGYVIYSVSVSALCKPPRSNSVHKAPPNRSDTFVLVTVQLRAS